jgi:Na+:H+ antiporter, NhaC family
MVTNEPKHLDPETKGPQPSLLDAIVPLLALIILLGLSYYLFGDSASSGPNQVALLFCGIIAAGIAYKNGMPWEGIRQSVVSGIAIGLPAMMILLAVGALIGAWSLSGTISSMVYYGLLLLSPDYFYATTALVCAIVAFSIGSSWTVAGTIGVGLMGIAASMNLSPAITAGAIISGAYFGDKASPLSDTVNLATATAGSQIYDHIRESLWTSIPSLVIAIGLFAYLGSAGDFDATPLLEGIKSKVSVSPWAFLPLVIVFVLSMIRFPAFVTIFIGALAGACLAILQDPERVVAFAAAPELPLPLGLVKGAWAALATGYVANTGLASIDQILTRGGMASMMSTIWLILAALSFGAVVEHAGLLNRLIEPLIAKVTSTAALVSTTIATAIGVNAMAADQYIAIALPSRLFAPVFAKRRIEPVVLSRVIGDSATVTSPLIPWNSCGAYMAITLGVPTTLYAAFCFFNILNPIMTILLTLLGLRVLRSVPAGQPAAGQLG